MAQLQEAAAKRCVREYGFGGGGAVWAGCERVEDDVCLLCAERPKICFRAFTSTFWIIGSVFHKLHPKHPVSELNP